MRTRSMNFGVSSARRSGVPEPKLMPNETFTGRHDSKNPGVGPAYGGGRHGGPQGTPSPSLHGEDHPPVLSLQGAPERGHSRRVDPRRRDGRVRPHPSADQRVVITATLVRPREIPRMSLKLTKSRLCSGSKGTSECGATNTLNVVLSPLARVNWTPSNVGAARHCARESVWQIASVPRGSFPDVSDTSATSPLV